MTGYWQRVSTNRVSRRKALKAGAAGLGAGALALAGCGGGGGDNGGNATPIVEGTPQAGGTVIYGLNSDPGHLDEQEGVTNYWCSSQFNGFLFHINTRTQEMMLQMADKFEQPDHLTYVWTLKPGIKFHNVDPVNGRVVTADDVVYSMTRRRDDPVSQNDKQFLRDFTAGFEAVDSQTYKLTTKQPYRPAIDELGNPSYPIVPHEAVEKFGSLADNPVGCGPYIVTEFSRAERVRSRKNPDYFMPGRPYLDNVEWEIILDASTLQQAFETGKHDYTTVPLDKLKVERLQSLPHVVVLDAPNYWRHTLLLRVDQDPFEDPRTWEAIDLTVDRSDLIEKMAFGEGKYTGPVPINLTQYTLPEHKPFFGWYNTEHHHCGIGFYTPADVHYGRVVLLQSRRQATLNAAYQRHPERFVRRQPQASCPPSAVWINPPMDKGLSVVEQPPRLLLNSQEVLSQSD